MKFCISEMIYSSDFMQEDICSLPSTNMATQNSVTLVPVNLIPYFGPLWHLEHVHVCWQNTHTYGIGFKA